MRVAFVGKGGSGKSSTAGTLCRLLARRGLPVLALDVDTMPGLALALGGDLSGARLPTGLAAREDGRGWQVRKGLRPATLVDRYAARGPDGVRFLELGKLPGRVEPSATVAFRYVLERFRRPGWAVVADLAAGTRQPMFGWAGFAGRTIVVVEPSAASILTARRLLPTATHMVVNKVRGSDDVELVHHAVSLPVLGAIPYDERLAEAEWQGLAPVDAVPDGPAVRAVDALAERLVQESA
jgi:CO dehydrogenase maturation factor